MHDDTTHDGTTHVSADDPDDRDRQTGDTTDVDALFDDVWAATVRTGGRRDWEKLGRAISRYDWLTLDPDARAYTVDLARPDWEPLTTFQRYVILVSHRVHTAEVGRGYKVFDRTGTRSVAIPPAQGPAYDKSRTLVRALLKAHDCPPSEHRFVILVD